MIMSAGGYDDGYASCACFWGRNPGSLVQVLAERLPSFRGLQVLDMGCGEGKNAAFFAERGAAVHAVDVSSLAISNGIAAWDNLVDIRWQVGDARTVDLDPGGYDVVLAYGLLHCLPSQEAMHLVLDRLKLATRRGGHFVVCSFNDRFQELHAHPGFQPCLLPHLSLLNTLSGWEIVTSSDTDLTEVHPHNGLSHTHSLTRILAWNPL